MTVDLDMMLDLRDVQVARDVQRRAEMGWFDVEFTMYGCTYQKNGERYYRVSAQEEKIYEYIENEEKDEVLASDICALSRKYPVPTGMQEYIAADVKVELAKEMAEKYPLDFFMLLEKLAQEAEENTAWDYLNDKMRSLEGTFDLKKFAQLKQETRYAYFHRKINAENYRDLLKMIAAEERYMEENIIVKDIFEKTFYAFAYEMNDRINYVINARKGHIYQKKTELEQKGIYTTPLYVETCYYNYEVRLPDVRKIFEKHMREYLNEEYFNFMRQIYTKNRQISVERFAKELKTAEKCYGSAAADTLRHYAVRWGIM